MGSPPWDESYIAMQNARVLPETAANAAITQDSNGITNINAAAGKEINFKIANANQMTLSSAGNVGINYGMVAATEKLDVNGNIKLTGALMPNNLPGTAGQVLVSAGAGVAPTWFNPNAYDTTGVATGIYNVSLSQYTIRVFNGISEIRLPNATTSTSKVFNIIGSNGITTKVFSSVAGNIYDDVTNSNITVINPNERYSVQSDGTNWIVIGR
jgi:hypothetical protein